MRIQLHEFQRKAVGELLAELEEARGELERRNKLQALVLSAPTGSGKTVIMSALIEAVLDAGHPEGEASEFPDEDASFLWITDQPELNTQTRNRMESYIDNWLGKIEVIDNSFNSEQLEAGKLYFINTQKLGKKGRLVNRGDRHQHTFWDTMRNTVDDRPSSVYVVIDEAHRGMAETARKQRQNEKDAESIVQRFIKGDTASGMPAVPIIIGVSATPERFQKLLEGTDRRERPVDVDSGDVQRSGLLKESILLRHSSSPADREMTLLHSATRRFLRFEEAWRAHHQRSGGHLVRPIMLVQVEDASSADQKQGRHSATDLAEALGVISGELRSGGVVLGPKVFAHAFQDAKTLDVSGTDLRGLAPAEIDDDPHVRVVFFKTALNTGWDCPRAEVMMSFRSANDPTNIAQLVGRMVRTPLRERVEGEHSDLLNAVDLYLPRYNEEALDAVVRRLTDETEETRTPARVVAVVDLELNPALPEAKECRSLLERLPTYEMTRQRRTSGTARLMKVARCLQRGPDANPVLEDATEIARGEMTEWLLDRLDQKRSEQQFDEALAEAGRVEIKVRHVSTADLLGDGSVESVSPGGRPAGEPEFEEIADRDLRRRIDRADRELGEGLARYLVRAREDSIKGEVSGTANGALRRARMEVLALRAADPSLKEALDRRADELIEEWAQRYAADIERLPDREREDLDRWLHPEGQVRLVESPSVPERITRRREKSEQNWDKHLYVEEDGQYFAKLNGWEEAVLGEELEERKDVVAWFRNKLGVDRWRLAVPYKKGVDTFLMYPDFIVFRRTDNGLVADVLDPHGLQFSDAVAKAHGLAEYAERHTGGPLGRVEAIAEIQGDDKLRRLDLSDRENREAVIACQNSIELAARLAGMELTPGKEAKYKKSESRQMSDENPPHRNRSTQLHRRGYSALKGYLP